MRLLKTKPLVSPWKWLNYNANWISNLTGCLLLKWRHQVGRNGIPKIGMGTYGKTLMKLRTLNSNESSLPVEANVPFSLEEMNSVLPEKTVMPPLRWLPWKTSLILLRTFPHYSSLFLDLLWDSSSCRSLNVKHKVWLNEEMQYTLQERYEFSNVYRQKSMEHVWK